ncbi:MAG: OmpA family protein [Devosia sp.]
MLDEVTHAGHHPDEDENYFVSMTDMMVGVLFIFIILLMVFALTFRSHTDRTDEQVKQLERAEETARTVATKLEQLQRAIDADIKAIQAAESVRSQLLHQIQERLAQQHLAVDIDDATGVVHLTDAAILFAPDQYQLNAVDTANVTTIASVLAEVLPAYLNPDAGRADYLETVFIEGHTDETGIKDRNWDLSARRAVQTFLGLRDAQPGLVALRNHDGSPIFSVSGYADTRPMPNTNASEYDKQRRIDLRFVMNTDDKAKLDETKKLAEQMGQLVTYLRQSIERAAAGEPGGS